MFLEILGQRPDRAANNLLHGDLERPPPAALSQRKFVRKRFPVLETVQVRHEKLRARELELSADPAEFLSNRADEFGNGVLEQLPDSRIVRGSVLQLCNREEPLRAER